MQFKSFYIRTLVKLYQLLYNMLQGRYETIFEKKIEKSVPRITDWHHEAGRVMANGALKGQIFLSHLHTNNGFFFFLATVFFFILKSASRNP